MSDFLRKLGRETVAVNGIRKGHGVITTFGTPEECAEFIRQNDGEKISWYYTLNPMVRPEKGRGKAADVTGIFALPIDIDAVRNKATEMSATESEKQETLVMANIIGRFLGSYFPKSSLAVVDSGNGTQMLLVLNKLADKSILDLWGTFLEMLAFKYSNEKVKLDTSVADAPRILALPGTVKRKGESTEERPHRPVELLYWPEDGERYDADHMVRFLERLVAPWRDRTMRKVVQHFKGLTPGSGRFYNTKLILRGVALKYAGYDERRVTQLLDLFSFVHGAQHEDGWSNAKQDEENEHLVETGLDAEEESLGIREDGGNSWLTEDEAAFLRKEFDVATIKAEETIEKMQIRGEKRAPDEERPGAPAEYETMTLDEMLTRYDDYKTEWLIKDIAAIGEVTMLCGEQKEGKTTLCLQMSQRVASGDPWPFARSRKKETYSVVYYSLETDPGPLTSRVKKLKRALPGSKWSGLGDKFVIEFGGTELNWSRIEAKIRERKIKLCIIDNVLAATSMVRDMNKNEEVAKIINEAKGVARRNRCAIIIVTHTRKRAQGNKEKTTFDDMMGARAWGALATINVCLTTKDGTVRHKRKRIEIQSRIGPGRTFRAIYDKEGYWRRSQKSDEDDKIDDDDDGSLDEEQEEANIPIVVEANGLPISATNENEKMGMSPEWGTPLEKAADKLLWDEWEKMTPEELKIAKLVRSAIRAQEKEP